MAGIRHDQSMIVYLQRSWIVSFGIHSRRHEADRGNQS
jgi:hypothetical protein